MSKKNFKEKNFHRRVEEMKSFWRSKFFSSRMFCTSCTFSARVTCFLSSAKQEEDVWRPQKSKKLLNSNDSNDEGFAESEETVSGSDGLVFPL